MDLHLQLLTCLFLSASDLRSDDALWLDLQAPLRLELFVVVLLVGLTDKPLLGR